MARWLSVLAILALAAAPAEAGFNRLDLTWQDNSVNEANFHVERKPGACSAAGTFAEIATVGAGVTAFADTSTMITDAPIGAVFCYRVRASAPGTPLIFSGYTNTAEGTVSKDPSNLVVR